VKKIKIRMGRMGKECSNSVTSRDKTGPPLGAEGKTIRQWSTVFKNHIVSGKKLVE
jgi:hypothetical protein